MEAEKIYRGIDLLDLIIDFNEMTPDKGEWTLENIKSNPPRYIRFQRIQALIKAFLDPKPPLSKPPIHDPKKIPNFLTDIFKGDSEKKNSEEKSEKQTAYSINDVENGIFLDKRAAKDFEEVSELVKNYLKERNHRFNEPTREHDYMWFHASFVSLFRYKAKLNALLSSSIQECPRHFSAIISVHLTNDISKQIKNVGKELNEILELLINPNKLQFTETELIAQYDFPKDNLLSVDGDYY